MAKTKTREDFMADMTPVEQLVETINKVCGLNENWAKTAIYYAAATHKIMDFVWFPALAFVGAPGTGKSKALEIMSQLCCKPYRIACHATMSPATLRDEFCTKQPSTVIIEEADLYPNRKQLQSYIINRVDKLGTSGLAVKEQIDTPGGAKVWRTLKKGTYGATVIHDRNSLDDLAAESRVITIPTTHKKGNFIEPPQGLILPAITLGSVPSYFTTTGRAFDTWKPLLMVADGFGDVEWLIWAHDQLEEATGNLTDGYAYEEKQAIFSQVIKAYCENSGALIVKETDGLILQGLVVEPLRKEIPYLSPRTVAKVLTKMGLKVVRHGGTNKLFTSVDKLKKVAKEIGYEDEIFN